MPGDNEATAVQPAHGTFGCPLQAICCRIDQKFGRAQGAIRVVNRSFDAGKAGIRTVKAFPSNDKTTVAQGTHRCIELRGCPNVDSDGRRINRRAVILEALNENVISVFPGHDETTRVEGRNAGRRIRQAAVGGDFRPD